MAAAMPFVMMAGSVISAAGQFQQGQAAASAAQYNSIMAAQNSEIQKRNAEIAAQSGHEQAFMQGLKTKAAVGATQANQGASGVSLNQGSHADVVTSQKELGLLDAIQVRNEATRHAYGYEVQSANDLAQSKLDRFQSSTAKTGSYLNAAGTLLGGAGKAYGAWETYKTNTGVGDTGGNSGDYGGYLGGGEPEWGP